MKSAVFAFLLLVWSGMAMAWPTRPITLIVPFAPGGLSAQIALAQAEDLEKSLGQKVLVRYMPGAEQAVALNHILGNDNDNHTFLITTDDMLVVAHVKGTNTPDRFAFTNILANFTGVLFGGPGATVERLRQQIREGKTINVGNMQFNGSWHLWSTNVQGININPVPYKGVAPLAVDVAGGSLEYGFSSQLGVQALLDEGKIVNLMTGGLRRHPAYPNVPTYRELGLKGDPAIGWIGWAARADTDPRALQAFADAIQASSRTNSYIQGMGKRGAEVINLGLDDSRRFIEQDQARVKRYKF